MTAAASEAPCPPSMISITEALEDEALFAPWFKGDSWSVWHAVLKAAFALPMDDLEIERFRSVAGRDPPARRVRELWIVAGRRAGKDSIASLIAAWCGIRDYSGLLRPGERASVMCLAVDRTQARLVLNYTRAYFERIPMLRELVTREVADGFELSTGADVSVMSSNFRSVRGRSIALAILDECAFWRSEESASPDTEVYGALVPGMATIPGSMLIGISSPHRRVGLIYQKWRDHFGKNDDAVLVIQASSRALNPTLPEKLITDALARDPAAARAEWLAEWRDDIAAYLPREMIESLVDDGVLVRPPVPGTRYHAFADPSGGVSDSFTCGIAHAEGTNKGVISLDCLVEIRAPFSPAAATSQISSVLKEYGLTEVVGDKYAASWVVDAFAAHNIRYEHSERDRSAIYADALPLFTAGRARILDDKRLVNQLASLERKTSFGRDRIGHPDRSGHHDDSANSACGALVRAADGRHGEMDITPELLAMAADPRWRAHNHVRPGEYELRQGAFFHYPGIGP
jgi:hypothetical protein